MDTKDVVKFLADILYLKGVINFDEFEAIMESHNFFDLDKIVEKIIRGEFDNYRRGEAYGWLDTSGTE